MKKLLVIAALTIAAAPAMASKARLSALGNSEQLTDVQTIFSKPAALAGLGNWATAELGATPGATVAGTAGAEGGFARSYGEGYLGFYMGHRNANVNEARNATTGTTTLAEENPIEIYYATKAGDMTWGASFWYSKSDKKATAFKQSSMGVRASVETGAVDAYLHLGLADTAEITATNKHKGGMPLTLGAGYTMGNGYVFANVTTVDAKQDTGGVEKKFKGSDYKVGYINSTKSEGSNFFYGVAYQGQNRGGDTASNYGNTQMPFWIGVEQEANSWMTLRASVKQNILLGGYNSTSGKVNTTDNNTTAAAGVGLKFNKLVLDASLAKTAGAQTGDINGNNLMSNASLTYMF